MGLLARIIHAFSKRTDGGTALTRFRSRPRAPQFIVVHSVEEPEGG